MNVREDLKAYIDDELTALRRDQVQQELDKDEDARREMEFMRLLGGEIREAAVQPEAVGLEKTLRWLERADSKPNRTRFPIWQTVLAVAGCAVLATFLFPVFAQSKASAKQAMLMADRRKAEESRAFSGDTTADNAPVAEPQLKGSAGARTASPSSPENMVNGSPDGFEMGRAPKSTIGRGGGPSPSDYDNSNAPNTKAPTSPLQRPLMIRTGEISVRVENVEKAEQDATHIVEGMGGIVQDTNVTGAKDQTGTAEMTVRVPEAKFTAAMDRLSKLGELLNHSSKGEDVTTQVADTEARLKVMRAEEEQYVTLLRGTRSIGQILEVKDRLSTVRQEIESLDAQRKALRSQTSFSTITLSMQEKEKEPKPAATPPANWGEDTLTSAKDALYAVGRFLAQTGIFLGVLSPIWVPLVIIGLWLRKRKI